MGIWLGRRLLVRVFVSFVVAMLALGTVTLAGVPAAVAAGDLDITGSTSIVALEQFYPDGQGGRRCWIHTVVQFPDVPNASYTVTVLDKGNDLNGSTPVVKTGLPQDLITVFVDSSVGILSFSVTGNVHWYSLSGGNGGGFSGPENGCAAAFALAQARFSVVSAFAHVANVPPVAQYSRTDDPGNPLHVTFDASASFDPDGEVESSAWSVTEQGSCGSACFTQSGTGTTLDVTAPRAGSYRVSLVVTDDGGAASDPYTRTEQIGAAGNQAPRALFTYAVDPANPLKVVFDGTGSSDPDGDVVRWDWDFGHTALPGSPSTVSGGVGVTDRVEHVFPTAGTYTVSLVVTDDDPTDPKQGASIQRVSVAAGLVVNSTADTVPGDTAPGDGTCSTGGTVSRNGTDEPECTLRGAIEEANASNGGTIRFDIPATPTISVGRALPALAGGVTIDGTTQPGVAIVFGGAQVGLVLAGNSNVVRGLEITGFDTGVEVRSGTLNVVSGNSIGVNAGATADGLTRTAVHLAGGSGTRVGGTTTPDGCDGECNVLWGTIAVVRVDAAADAAQISGNRIGFNRSGANLGSGSTAPDIGVDVAGNAARLEGNTILGRVAVRVSETATGTTVGGATPVAGQAPGNRIRVTGGTLGSGVSIFANMTRIAGNEVEPLASETQFGSGVLVGKGVSNRIGGNQPGEGNRIAGFATGDSTSTGLGIQVVGPAEATEIIGNIVGLAADGRTAYGNRAGIRVFGASSTVIKDNTVSGNFAGIRVQAVQPLQGALIEGNRVGTDVTGTIAVPNDRGIAADDSDVRNNTISGNREVGIELSSGTMSDNRVGTDVTGIRMMPNGGPGVRAFGNATIGGAPNTIAPNTIAFNAGPGIAVPRDDARVTIRNNHIMLNGGPGIDLGENGVTLNDSSLDADTGPNTLINFPVFGEIVPVGNGQVSISGWVDSTDLGGSYTVEVYANRSCPSAHGQGELLVGVDTTSVTRNGVFQVVGTPTSGYPGLTATVTGPDGSTSEFSRCITFRRTALTQAAAARSNRLQVADTTGFLGRVVTINPGGRTQERHYVTAIGSLVLAKPLRYDHAAGEAVVVTPDTLFTSVTAGAITVLPRAPDIALLSGTVTPIAGETISCGEDVSVRIGDLVHETVPGARFKRIGGQCVYLRTQPGSGIRSLLVDIARGTWSLSAGGMSLDTLSNPIDVVLSIGDNTGTDSITMTKIGPLFLYQLPR